MDNSNFWGAIISVLILLTDNKLDCRSWLEKNWFEQITRNINEHRKSVFATLPVLVMLWLQISAKRFLWDAVVDDKLVVQTIGTHLDVDSLKATQNKSLIASHRCESLYLLEDSWIPILKTYNCQMLEESRGSMGQTPSSATRWLALYEKGGFSI